MREERGIIKMKRITAFLLAFIIALQMPVGISDAVCIPDDTATPADIVLPADDTDIPTGLSGGEELRAEYADSDVQTSETKKYTYRADSIQLNKCVNRYGYDDLAKRSNGKERQRLYNDMLAFCIAFYSDTSDISNEIYVSGEKYLFADRFNFAEIGLTVDEALQTWIVFRHDNPIYYWISNTAVVTDSVIYLTLSDEYKLGTQRSAFNAKVEKAIDEYLKLTENLSTKFEKALAVHDKICKDVSYAKDSNGNPSSEAWAHNILGVFDNKEAVCESYAKVYQLILTYIGIENIYVTGVSGSQNHAWNMVKLDDGEWHFIDVTWDDTSVEDEYTYLYFALGKDKFDTSHTANTPNNKKLDFLYDLPAASNVTYTPINLVENETGNTVLCRNISDALKLVENQNFNYRIELFRYANDCEIEAGSLPKAESILFKGNYYDRSGSGSGNFYVDKIFAKGNITFNGNVFFENADVRFYNATASSVTFELGGGMLGFSGKFCRLYAHINGENASSVDISGCKSIHFHGNINTNEMIISTGNCSLLGSEYNISVLSVKNGTTDIRESMVSKFTEIKTVNIPQSVTLVSSSAFCKNKKLSAINVDADNKTYTSCDGVLYKMSSGKPEKLTAYPAAKPGDTYRLRYGTKIVCDNAFANAVYLKKIYLYKGITSIGSNAFAGTKNLQAVFISGSAADIASDAFDEDTKTLIYGIKNSYADTYASENNIGFVKIKEYTYKFVNYDGSVISERTGFENEPVILPQTNPSRPSTQYVAYTFAGWNGYKDGMTLDSDKVFTANYTETVEKYTYRFLDVNGNVVKKATVKAGSEIIPPSEYVPVKKSDAQYIYEFAGWRGFTDGMTINSDIDFEPIFNSVIRHYRYTFYADDGKTVIKTATVPYGTVIVCPEAPSKPANGTVRYVFKGWKNYSDGMTVSGNAEFYAEFTEEQNTFTYIFYDEDGMTEIKRTTGLYGDVIECPSDPVKEKDGVKYTFTGWTGYKYGMKLTQNISFKANYGVFANPCRYVFYDDDGSIISKGVCEKGGTVDLPENPVKANTAEYCWKFEKWSGYTAGMTIESDVSFTAVYKKTVREYKYTFYDDDRITVIATGTLPYGSVITAPEHSRENTKQYTYKFSGWENYTSGMKLKCDMDFYAQYNVTENEYTYKFIDYNGTVITQTKAVYGTLIVKPQNPQRTGYVFKGWIGYEDGMLLKDDVTFVAQYEISQTGITSSVYNVDKSGLYLKGVSPKTTRSEFLANIDNVLTVKLFGTDGREIKDPEKFVGTGMTVKLIGAGGAVLQQLIIIVAGDTNGDGEISITDFMRIKKHLLSDETFLSGAELVAADYNTDGYVTITDFVQVKSYLLNQ